MQYASYAKHNGTMDRQHVPTSLPLLRRGYDLLLEKHKVVEVAFDT